MLTQLNQLRDRAHRHAREKGFYDAHLDDAEILALVIEEIGEAIAADRRGMIDNTALYKSCIEKGLTQKKAYKHSLKGTLAEELADIAIRLLDFAGYKEIDLSCPQEDVEEIQSLQEVYDKIFLFKISTTMRFAFKLSIELNRYINNDEVGEMKGCFYVHLMLLNSFAKSKGIDLLYHIEQKMEYNTSRPKKHGKKR